MSDSLTETFPRLVPDSAESCPCPLSEIQEYLRLEDGDGSELDRSLHFVRTARAFNSDYWIWEYRLADGRHCYVTVEKSGHLITTCMDWGTDRFTPEEYIVNQRHRSGRTQ